MPTSESLLTIGLDLGTSGVLFVASADAAANPERGVHSFCHALPNSSHQMAVMLSASSSLAWLGGIKGASPAELLVHLPEGQVRGQAPIFLP